MVASGYGHVGLGMSLLDHHLGNGGVHRALIQREHLNQLVQMEGIVDGGIREQVGS